MKEKIIQSNKFDEINKDFIQKIESLRETLPLVMLFVQANHSRSNSAFSDFVKKNGIDSTNEEGEEYVSFSTEDSHKYRILEKNVNIVNAAVHIIPNSLFVSLISQFDSYLGSLIREIFEVKPQILNSSEKNLSFSKLAELKTIEELKEFIIEKEIETVLRDSHSDHFIWLENKLSLALRKDLPIWQEFIEITERRNLFVHNDGIVSSQYLTICRQNNVKFEVEPKLGEKLNVDDDYFEKAYRCLFELSVKLTQVIWRKLLPSDLEFADESLNDICFDLLRQGQTELTIVLLDFATQTLKKHFNEETKNVFIVNKALAFKLNNQIKECQDIVNSKDWSASSDKFKIAKEALLDNHEEVVKLMRRIGNEGEIEKISYKTWPLFENFRKTELFTSTFKEVFDEEYVAVDTPKKMLEEIFSKIQESPTKKTTITVKGRVSKKVTATKKQTKEEK
ncbi:hypothetical protein FLJC2902T_31690 [Flavobacterium limnosediminis JC2902]|uniref:Uncharacterized protein n=1 Tax=Flavobacterium limnosediminis JC2902 TaxID=1341181 RepID=V6SG53_9FLAO|nr:hypothetical protein [Flavobacterium limnosediminis]ESU25227.1 hypothetical protein FLJC2902T_31690 [Flavobacterium limnosediminis JC2902]